MPPIIATLVYSSLILALFMLDRERQCNTSKALWIPVLWLLLSGSREPSQWLFELGIEQSIDLLDITDRYLEGQPFDRIVYSCLVGIGTVVLIRRGRKAGRLLHENLPILAFFIYCAISIFWTDYPAVAFKRWIKAAGDVVMVMVVLTDFDRTAALKRFLSRATFFLVPLSILFIKYYPLGKQYHRFRFTPVYVGVTNNKNLLGMMCLILGLASIWRFLSAYRGREIPHRTRHLVVHGSLIVMVLWLFWMANSVTSLGCFLLGGGVMAATMFNRLYQKPSRIHLLIAATLFIPFAILFLGFSESTLRDVGRDPSITGRSGIWDVVINMNDNILFGKGFEGFWIGERLEKILSTMPGIQEAHNGYIEVYLNLGWSGVILLTIIIVTAYRRIMAMVCQQPEEGRLMLAYFVVGLIYNMTEAGFRMRSLVWIAFLLAAMSASKSTTFYKQAVDI
jgi:exopolysaccharide production protein ExoQ